MKTCCLVWINITSQRNILDVCTEGDCYWDLNLAILIQSVSFAVSLVAFLKTTNLRGEVYTVQFLYRQHSLGIRTTCLGSSRDPDLEYNYVSYSYLSYLSWFIFVHTSLTFNVFASGKGHWNWVHLLLICEPWLTLILRAITFFELIHLYFICYLMLIW